MLDGKKNYIIQIEGEDHVANWDEAKYTANKEKLNQLYPTAKVTEIDPDGDYDITVPGEDHVANWKGAKLLENSEKLFGMYPKAQVSLRQAREEFNDEPVGSAKNVKMPATGFWDEEGSKEMFRQAEHQEPVEFYPKEMYPNAGLKDKYDIAAMMQDFEHRMNDNPMALALKLKDGKITQQEYDEGVGRWNEKYGPGTTEVLPEKDFDNMPEGERLLAKVKDREDQDKMAGLLLEQRIEDEKAEKERHRLPSFLQGWANAANTARLGIRNAFIELGYFLVGEKDDMADYRNALGILSSYIKDTGGNGSKGELRGYIEGAKQRFMPKEGESFTDFVGKEDYKQKMRDIKKSVAAYDKLVEYLDEAQRLSEGDDEKYKGKPVLEIAFDLLNKKAGGKLGTMEYLAQETAIAQQSMPETRGFAAWLGGLVPMIGATATGMGLSTVSPVAAGIWGKATMGSFATGAAGNAMEQARMSGASDSEVFASGLAAGGIMYAMTKIPYNKFTQKAIGASTNATSKQLAEALNNPESPIYKETELLWQNARKAFGTASLFSKEHFKEWAADAIGTSANFATMGALEAAVPMIYANPDEYPALNEMLRGAVDGAIDGLAFGAVTASAAISMRHSQNIKRWKNQGGIMILGLKDGSVAEIIAKDGQPIKAQDLEAEYKRIKEKLQYARDILSDYGEKKYTEERAHLAERLAREVSGVNTMELSQPDFVAAGADKHTYTLLHNGKVVTIGEQQLHADGRIVSWDNTLETIKKYNEVLRDIVSDVNKEGFFLEAGKREAEQALKDEGIVTPPPTDGFKAEELGGDTMTDAQVNAAVEYNVAKGAADEAQNQRRADVSNQISDMIGQPFWRSNKPEGVDKPIETVTSFVKADGSEVFVINEQDGQFATVDEEGKPGFISRDKIEAGLQDGTIIKFNDNLPVEQYLDGKIVEQDAMAEAERINTEYAENLTALQEAVVAMNGQFNIGSPEAEQLVPIIDMNPAIEGGITVQTEEGPRALPWKEVAQRLGLPFEPKTNEQLINEKVEADRQLVQDAKAESGEPLAAEAAEPVASSSEPVASYDDPVANEMGIPADFMTKTKKGRNVVNTAALWERNPALLVQYNDRTNTLGMSSMDYLNAKIAQVDTEITKQQALLQNEVLTTNDEDKKEDYKDKIADLTERRQQIADILQPYLDAQAAEEARIKAEKEAAKALKEQEKADKEAIKAEEQDETLREPMNLEEAVANFISGIKPNSLDKADFARELGWGDEELKRFFPYWAKSGKGMTVNDLAQRISHDDTSGYVPMDINADTADTQAIRDAILSVFQASVRPTDVKDYTKNANLQRRAEAEAYAKGLQEAQEAEIPPVEDLMNPTVAEEAPAEAVEAVIEQARQEVDVNPTDAQKEAGNYKKGHLVIDGYEFTLENPKGSVRSGKDVSGKEWSQVMNNDYGYIRGTEGVDGDHIDMFLSDNPTEGNVFVIDQVDSKTGKFDEHKVMYGFNSAEEARDAYLSNYEEGWQGLGAITEVTKDEFRKWIDSSHRKTKPFSEYKSIKAEGRVVQGLENRTEQELLDNIAAHIKEATGGELEIKDMKLIGSRTKGTAKTDSDLDVLVQYEGGLKEDEAFNAVNAKPLVIDGIKVDVNPIRKEETGTIKDWEARQAKWAEEDKNNAAEVEDMPEDLFSLLGTTREQAVTDRLSEKLFEIDRQIRLNPERKAELMKERVAAIQEFADAAKTTDNKAVATTIADLPKVMSDAGYPAEFIMKAWLSAIDALSHGVRPRGFRVLDGKVFLLADCIMGGRDASTTFTHEEEHSVTRAKGDHVALAGMKGFNRENILDAIDGWVGVVDQYHRMSDKGVADEFISHAIERTEFLDDEGVAKTLADAGVKDEEIVNFVKNRVNERRNRKRELLSEDRGRGRADALRHGSTQDNLGENGRDSQTRSRGDMGEQGLRLGEQGQRGTEGRRETAGAGRGDQADAGAASSAVRRAGEDLKPAERARLEDLDRDGTGKPDIIDNLNDATEGTSLFSLDKKNRSLVGLHNISAEKLRKAIRLGGLANPSCAVIDLNFQNHFGYGDISLVMPSSLVDSKMGRNAGTFTGDAYTPTFPTVKLFETKQSEKNLKEMLSVLPKELADYINRKTYDFINGDVYHSGLEVLFLKEKGIETEILGREKTYPDASMDEFLTQYLKVPADFDYMSYDTLMDAYHALSEEERENVNYYVYSQGNKEDMAVHRERMEKYPKMRKHYTDDLGFGRLNQFIYVLDKDQRTAGEPDLSRTIEEAQRKVASNGYGDEFENWLTETIDKLGYEAKIFSHWTYDGTKIWKKATLENISAKMRKDALQNASEDVHTNATKALLLKKLRSLKDIRDNRGLLAVDNAEEYNEASDAWSDVTSDLSDMQVIDSNPFINRDIAARRLQEAILTKDPIAYLNKEYGYSLEKGGEFEQKLNEAIDLLKAIPSKYFETKFQRPVYFSEFAAVVIPDDTPLDVRQALEQTGLKLYEYKGDERIDERAAAVRKAAEENDGVLFSFIGKRGAEAMDIEDKTRERRDNLAVARQMEKDKATPGAIKWATGWERGADGMWRYEIPDFTKLDLFGDVMYDKRNPDHVRYKELLRKTNAAALMPESHEPLTTEEMDEYNKLYRKYNGGVKRDMLTYGMLEDFIDADDLFKAYPQLRHYTLRFEDMPDKVGGYAEKRGVVLNMKNRFQYEKISDDLLHEIQHEIQDIEGFSLGTGLKAAERKAQVLNSQPKDKLTDEEWDFVNLVQHWSYFVKETKPLDKFIHDFFEESVGTSKLDDYYKNNLKGKSADELKKLYNQLLIKSKKKQVLSSWDVYKRTAGEVEARNASRRRKFTLEERRASAAENTEDVSRADQILNMPASSLLDWTDDEDFSIAMQSQKQPGKTYIKADEEDLAFSLSKNNRGTIEKWLDKREDLSKAQKAAFVGWLDGLSNPTLQLATARWFTQGAIRLPEDMPKVEQAVSVAGKAKVDPLKYKSPMELLDAHADFKATEKRINPDEVSTLHKAKEFKEHGITVYDVDDSEESRQNMRQIINTHFGKEASPWCLLQGDGNGNLTEQSAQYWKHYNGYPKQVVFKDGKLLAFSANDDKKVRLWWDRQDSAHYDIPAGWRPIKGDALGRETQYVYSENGMLKPEENSFMKKGNRENGEYTEWYPNGNMSEHGFFKNGKPDGLYEYYNEGKGYIYSRINYKEGVQEGLSEYFHPNGNLRSRTNWKDGRIDGTHELFYEDGSLSYIRHYKNGNYDGFAASYNRDGTPIETLEFKNGREHGKHEIYYSDGKQVKLVEYYDEGKLHGAKIRYDYEGHPKSIENYVHGARQGVQEYYDFGPGKLALRTTEKDNIVRKSEGFDAGGQLAFIKRYNEYGEPDGVWKFFTRDGKIYRMLQYENGIEIRDLLAEGIPSWEAEDDINFSLVTDKDELEGLEKEPTIRAYRAMALIDGQLYPPMSQKEPNAPEQKGQKMKARPASELGKWEKADEAPEKAYEKDGKWYFDLKKNKGSNVNGVLYNPYIHTSASPLNDQFTSASNRPELVTVEVEIPMSELGSGYKADKANDSVGAKDWHSGTVTAQLGEGRQVILSRWAKPVRIVPNAEVAAMIAPKLKEKNITVPYNVVTPSLRAELEKLGVKIGGEQEEPMFSLANKRNEVFVSNAAKAVEGISMEKATPEQWLKMIEKNGGLKAGEDKWIGLSDWLKASDKKTITKQEVLDYIGENKIQIEEVKYGDGDISELRKLYPTWDEAFFMEENDEGNLEPHIEDLDAAVELYNSENITSPWLHVSEDGDLEEGDDGYDTLLDWANKVVVENAHLINSTRLDYTTDGLDHKREIALTVPTIEPWNKNDQIHFGDAGEGRAIAWIRFGDASIEHGVEEAEKQYRKTQEALNNLQAEMDKKYGNVSIGQFLKLASEEDRERFYKMDAENNKAYREWKNPKREKVLFIDEIQSKRHQEARENGYKDEAKIAESSAVVKQMMKDYGTSIHGLEDEIKNAKRDAVAKIQSLYYSFQTRFPNGWTKEEEIEQNGFQNIRLVPDPAIVGEDDADWYVRQSKKRDKASEDLDKLYKWKRSVNGVPAAPFEKNWHELAMKRMLRLAAEEGYDYMVWTTGEQQAERYNIGGVVKKIVKSDDYNIHERTFAIILNDGKGSQYLTTDEEGKVVSTIVEDFRGKNLSEIFGKELAVRMLSMKEGDTIEEEGLRIGGEGMKGFYDQMLPAFMNKYGKKWGVKVEDINLPDLEGGLTAHAVPVTEEMKASVMEGQPMFSFTKIKDVDVKREKLQNTTPIDVVSGAIKADDKKRAITSAVDWWNKNVENGKRTYETEVGEIDIDTKSIKESLSKGFSQPKLDAVTSLAKGFETATYLTSMEDMDGKELTYHYFAYPINYENELSYVLCRAKKDMNTRRLYVHEVFPLNVIKGELHQTRADQSQPPRGIALYLDLLREVLGTKVANDSEFANNSEENSLQMSLSSRQDAIKSVDEKGLAGIMDADEVREFRKGIYELIPVEIRSQIVDQAFGSDLNIKNALNDYLLKLTQAGTENDETGLLRELYNQIRDLSGNENLTDADCRYIIWREAAGNTPLSFISEAAYKNRFGAGKEEPAFSMTAYHGTGKAFDRFSADHIGEGQGHQSHGWGHYVAFNEKTSRLYAITQGLPVVHYNGKDAPTYYGNELLSSIVMDMEQNNTSFEEARQKILEALYDFEDRKNRGDVSDYWKNHSNAKEIAFFENEVKESDFVREERRRNLYTVSVPDDTGTNYLDEQKELSKEQRNIIAEALRALPEDAWKISADEAMLFNDHTAAQLANSLSKRLLNGYEMYSELTHGLGSKKAASEFLSDAGFVGIKYDGRQDGPCAVIFKDEDITIDDHAQFSFTKEFGDITEENREKAGEKIDAAAEALKETKAEAKEDSKVSALKAINKAMRGQKAYDKSTVDSIVRLAKDILKDGKISTISRKDVNRLLGLVNASVGKSPAYVNKYADELLDNMLNIIVKNEEEKLEDLINIKDKVVNQSGVEAMGKLDLLGQETMKALRAYRTKSLEDIQARQAEISDQLSSQNDAVRKNAWAEKDGLDLAEQYVNTIGASETEEYGLRAELKELKDSKQAGAISKEAYKEFVATTKEAIRENLMDRVDAYRTMAATLGSELKRSTNRRAAFRQAEQDRVEAIHYDANRDLYGESAGIMQKETWLSKVVNKPVFRFFFQPLATFDQMMRLMAKHNITGEGFLYNRFMRGWLEAREKYLTSLREGNKVLDDKVSEVFGKEMKWVDLYNLDKKLPTMEVRMWDKEKMADIELTQGQLLYIYMVNKMTDGKMKLRKMGIKEEDVQAIRENLDPRFLELADWLQTDYLPKRRNYYNAVHEQLFGAPMAAIEDYFPLKIAEGDRYEEMDVAKESPESALSSTVTAHIIKRTKNAKMLDILHANAFDVAMEHLESMEEWAAMAPFRKDLNTLLSYTHFKNQVKNMTTVYGSGNQLWKNLVNVSRIVAGTYNPEGKGSFLTNVSKGVTSGKINFRLHTALKQMLSYPAFWSEARADDLAKALVNPLDSWRWCMENLPVFQRRWEKRTIGDTRLMESDSDWKVWKKNFVKKASRYGMTPNALIDALTIAVGSKAVYDAKYRKYIADGLSEEEADKKAKQDATVVYNESQQSDEDAFVAAVQKDRTFEAAGITTFRNASMGYQRKVHNAYRTLGRMARGNKDAMIDSAARQYAAEGMEWNEAKSRAEKEWKKAGAKAAGDIFIYQLLLNYLWKIGPLGLAYILVGDDDDKRKKKLLDPLVTTAITGFFEGLSTGGTTTDVIAGLVSGDNYKQWTFLGNPILQDIQNLGNTIKNKGLSTQSAYDVISLLVQGGIGVDPHLLSDTYAAIVDAAEGDMGIAKEIAFLLMRISQMPQSTMKDFYIDEIQMTAKEAGKAKAKELAERYVEYKKMRRDPLGEILPKDKEQEKKEKKSDKAATTKLMNEAFPKKNKK